MRILNETEPDMNQATISAIYRYPVKGLSPQPLTSAEVEADAVLPFDRAFAIENGASGFDPIAPEYLTKAKFLQLMSNEKLATLDTEFDDTTGTLKIIRDGKQVAAGNLSQPIGRTLIEQFLSAYMKDDVRGGLKVVTADNHHFCDVPDRFVSLINLASLREMERAAGRTIDPLRFRANIYVDGWEPWAERKLIGATLAVGRDAVFRIAEPIGRCAATNVDPATGARDMHIPRMLAEAFERDDCGVYLTAVAPGTIGTGDKIAVVSNNAAASAGDGLGIR